MLGSLRHSTGHLWFWGHFQSFLLPLVYKISPFKAQKSHFLAIWTIFFPSFCSSKAKKNLRRRSAEVRIFSKSCRNFFQTTFKIGVFGTASFFYLKNSKYITTLQGWFPLNHVSHYHAELKLKPMLGSLGLSTGHLWFWGHFQSFLLSLVYTISQFKAQKSHFFAIWTKFFPSFCSSKAKKIWADAPRR